MQLQSTRDSGERFEGDVSLSAFYRAYVGAVQPTPVGELLLRQVLPGAEGAQVPSERAVWVYWHR